MIQGQASDLFFWRDSKITNTNNRPSLNTVLSTAEFYGLSTVQEIAKQVGIPKADIELTPSAFNLQF